MGYGFCLPDNTADRVSLMLSSKTRGCTEEIGGLHHTPAGQERMNQAHEAESLEPQPSRHWVSVAPPMATSPLYTTRPSLYQFSDGFLLEFSVLASNHREDLSCDSWGDSQNAISPERLSRNKLYVTIALLVHLQRRAFEITKHDIDLPGRPQNKRQEYAAMYRNRQLRILESVLDALRSTMNFFESHGPTNGVVRLENILSQSPKALSKDFRSVIHTALGTRNEARIRECGGEECAFTLWLCGLITLSNSEGLDSIRGSEFEERILNWIRWLKEVYHLDLEGGLSMQQQEMMSQTSDGMDNMRDSKDVPMIAASYLEAIKTDVEKHPQSLYAKRDITTSRLELCLYITRQEGVPWPNAFMEYGREVDEYVLFLETGEKENSE